MSKPRSAYQIGLSENVRNASRLREFDLDPRHLDRTDIQEGAILAALLAVVFIGFWLAVQLITEPQVVAEWWSTVSNMPW